MRYTTKKKAVVRRNEIDVSQYIRRKYRCARRTANCNFVIPSDETEELASWWVGKVYYVKNQSKVNEWWR